MSGRENKEGPRRSFITYSKPEEHERGFVNSVTAKALSLSVPVQLHRTQNQVTGYPNWGQRPGKLQEQVGWKLGSRASVARETISPLKALMEMPDWSSHLETIAWHWTRKQIPLLPKCQECRGPTLPIFKGWQAPKTSEQILTSGALRMRTNS